MAITVKNFRARFPEFCDEQVFDDDRIELFIADTITLYLGDDENRWNGKYDIAQAYLAAHLLFTATGSEAGDGKSKVGPISSKSAGGVSVTRSVSTKDRSDGDEFFITSTYGQQFISIRNMCFIGVLVANSL